MRYGGGSVAVMLDVVASGYHGPPNLTVARGFTSWMLDGWSLAWILTVTVLYVIGVVVVRRRGQAWPAGRIIAFCALLPTFSVIATMSSVGVYQPVLFYMRSVQTILFLLLIPLFFALGRPLTLVIETVPRFGPWLRQAIGSRAARVIFFPAITSFVLVVTPFVLYFTPWYAAGFRSVLVAQLTHLALAVPGFVFFWTLLRLDPVPKAYAYVVTLWITAAEVIGDALLGLAVVADTSRIAGAYYYALARPWGPSVPTDQMFGGATLWVLGDVVGLPFLAAQLIQMIREDESEAAVIDAELDAQEAAQAAEGAVAAAAAANPSGSGSSALTGNAPKASNPAASSSAGGGEDGRPAMQRPWWETDRRFADRFRPVDDSGAGPGGAPQQPAQ